MTVEPSAVSPGAGGSVSELRKTTSGKGVLRLFLSVLFAGVIFFGAWFLVLIRDISYSHGSRVGQTVFRYGKSENARTLASRLEDEHIIKSGNAFLLFLFRERSWKNLQSGDYLLSGDMTIPEIVDKLVRGDAILAGTKVTFPEGFTILDMADRLTENGLPGDEFRRLATKPDPAFRKDYSFLSNLPAAASLEGVLFPDTYYFSSELGADGIIRKMLDGFVTKAAPVLSVKSGADWYGTLTLASIVEMEVRTGADRRTVADIFLRRIEAGMPLQSDATVRYALGETKVKHSLADISIDSPYNTYANKGLPPGPVSNPGLTSIRAVLDPLPNKYLYFLNNTETGETVFAVTFDEHVANKAKNGL
ncbi:MAG: endolytic transglycosylase MltG [Candidatus Moranbacteria bacterium]|nr:endolytic transglycosylase MltG [Candidatus Moranbacteria bacterium]